MVDEISNFRKNASLALNIFPHENQEFAFCGCLGGKRTTKIVGGLIDDVECDKCKSFWHLTCAGLAARPRRNFICPVCNGKWKDVYAQVFHK